LTCIAAPQHLGRGTDEILAKQLLMAMTSKFLPETAVDGLMGAFDLERAAWLLPMPSLVPMQVGTERTHWSKLRGGTRAASDRPRQSDVGDAWSSTAVDTIVMCPTRIRQAFQCGEPPILARVLLAPSEVSRDPPRERCLNMRSVCMGLLAVVLGGVPVACNNRANVQCETDPNCNLTTGGVCAPASTGNQWCAYPDPGCPSGYRYSDLDVGDGLSGVCVPLMTDAGMADGKVDPGPALGWAKAFGSTGRDVFHGLALTSNGDVVAVGSIEGSVSFGGPSLPNKGERDAAVARFDSTGKHIWSKSFGGTSTDDIAAVAADEMGNIYLVGSFVGSIDIDGLTLTSMGSNDAFLAKLDGATGDRVWALRFGALEGGFELERAIAVSADSTRVSIVGEFFGTANFGGANVTHSGAGDVFAAVYSTADGSHLWSRGFGGTGIDEASGVAFDANDGVVISGKYVGPASFGGPQPLTSNNSILGDVFVARYTASNGAFVWANGYGSANTDIAYKVRVVAGAAYVVGSFSPSPGMGISLGGATLMSAGGSDGFVAKYDAATGSHIWSKSIGGPGEERSLDLAVTDQIWTAISFSGDTQIGNASYTSVGISDVALGSFNLATGTAGESRAFGGPDVDVVEGVVATATALCVAGSFGLDHVASPSSITVFGNPLSGAGFTDGFIACKAP
jgi:hypothetical protein